MLMHWFTNGQGLPHGGVSGVLDRVLEAVHRAGGRMVIERCPPGAKSRYDVWDDVGPPLAIMRRLKEQYDPKGVLNPGRFVGGI
jgi:glycolate oxidase FAD binding subunit